MTNPYSEDRLVEQTAISLIQPLWGKENFLNAYSEDGEAQLMRENRGEVILKRFLLPALKLLNPELPAVALDQAVEELTRDRSVMTLVNANEQIWRLLRDGVSVEIEKDGETVQESVKLIDFDHPENNHFFLVSQLWVTGELHTRRPDLVGFVNGIPLVLFELKASHKNLKNAYQQNIRDYKDTIPQIFWYSAFIVLSNGIEAKVGTLTSAYEHFHEWKKINEEDETSSVGLETVIKGTCRKDRLLDIVENFTLYDASRGEKAKLIARYHQLIGVNRAVAQVQNRDQNHGKLGVFWHTQGSGKSYSMVFFSQKVLRKLPGNYTFVVVTDRAELDKQIYKNFASCGAVYEQEVQAESIAHLRQLLKEDHRHIFTLIHKFGTRDGEEPPVLSERSDIIVMADEAHRTQYDTLALNMRLALPNSSFIGFTGTPLIAGEEEQTRQTFGKYISVYDFAQSVKDGTTVPLYYENRVPHLENVNRNIEKDLEKIMDFYELSDGEEEKLEQEFSTFYHLITRDDRLEKVAEDIVQHFTARMQEGKGMVVSIDKLTAVKMYLKVKEQFARQLAKFKNQLKKAVLPEEIADLEGKIRRIEELDMAVVVSQSQNEIDDFRQHEIDFKPIRQRIVNEDLETEFKNPDSPLRLVFVCAMWITGFDVPSLSTLYLDKPLKNHTLMQTIARVNRVYEGKECGLIVDYIGVFRNLQRALAVYAAQGTQDIDDIIKDKQELMRELEAALNEAKRFLLDLKIDIDAIIRANKTSKLQLIADATNAILADEDTKKIFGNIASTVRSHFKSLLPSVEAEPYREEVLTVGVLADRVKEVTDAEGDTEAVEQIKRDLEALLDESIKAGEYVIYDLPKLKDLSSIDFDALRSFFEGQQQNIAIERLKNLVQREAEEMTRRNQTRQKFLERLNALLHEYNSGSKDKDEFFAELMELAKALSEEQKRAVSEGLNEEELAIFDILRKENLTPDEEQKVKKASQELLQSLSDKLSLDWRKKQDARADVKVTIRSFLFSKLPEPTYTEQDCSVKTEAVYLHVFDRYMDAKHNAFAMA